MEPARPADPKTAGLPTEPNALKRLGKAHGPGLITGASDDDPSGTGTGRVDQRVSQVHRSRPPPPTNGAFYGTHNVDMAIAQGNLVELVRRQVANYKG